MLNFGGVIYFFLKRVWNKLPPLPASQPQFEKWWVSFWRMKDHYLTEWFISQDVKNHRKQNWVGVMKLHLKLHGWNHYLPVFFDKLWHEFNPSEPNSGTLTKNNKTKHKLCLLGAFLPPHDLARPGFLSLGYDGDFSIHRVPWKPQSREETGGDE